MRRGRVARRNPSLGGLFAVVCLFRAPLLHAATPAVPLDVQVERSSGAESCPATEQLVERVVALGTPEADTSLQRARVTFGREQDAFWAEILAEGRKAGLRRLSAPGPDCAGLTSAVAVALAVLFDVTPSDVTTAKPKETLAAVPAEPTPAERPLARAAPAPQRGPWDLRFGLDAAVGAGQGLLGAKVTPSFALGMAWNPLGFRLAAEVFTTLPRDTAFQNGSVSVWLNAARIEACTFTGRGKRGRLGICPQLALGVLRGRGRHFDVVRTSYQPWSAAGLGVLGLVPLTARVVMKLRVSALVSLSENRFRVDGLGAAYRSEPIAFSCEAGPELRF